jgi:N-acetylglucosaminyldiphosphoundecaprenol N-acetyl-beta-D-mannosaminyltransferase
MKIDIFGVKIDNLTMDEALERIKGFVVLPYSEFIVRAQKDQEFKNILNSADFCLCEGRGLWLVARFLKKPIKEPINGVDLIHNLRGKIFLLGGKEGVAKKVKEKLDTKVVGTEHGHQDLKKVIKKINKAKPEILLVGLGSPKQEKWIYENLAKMPSVKMAVGVGGAFDFISGRVKRAPKFLQKIGLEWLWRLILQPRRIKRVSKGVIGLSWLVVRTKVKNR